MGSALRFDLELIIYRDLRAHFPIANVAYGGCVLIHFDSLAPPCSEQQRLESHSVTVQVSSSVFLPTLSRMESKATDTNRYGHSHKQNHAFSQGFRSTKHKASVKKNGQPKNNQAAQAKARSDVIIQPGRLYNAESDHNQAEEDTQHLFVILRKSKLL